MDSNEVRHQKDRAAKEEQTVKNQKFPEKDEDTHVTTGSKDEDTQLTTGAYAIVTRFGPISGHTRFCCTRIYLD